MIKNKKVDKTNPKDKIGAKKVSLSLFPVSAVIEGTQAMQNGADKYGAYNWRNNPVQNMIYIDALLRHIYAYIDGEDKAEDSGIDHLSHSIACLAILIDAKSINKLVDTRPQKGVANKLLNKYDKSTHVNKIFTKSQRSQAITESTPYATWRSSNSFNPEYYLGDNNLSGHLSTYNENPEPLYRKKIWDKLKSGD